MRRRGGWRGETRFPAALHIVQPYSLIRAHGGRSLSVRGERDVPLVLDAPNFAEFFPRTIQPRELASGAYKIGFVDQNAAGGSRRRNLAAFKLKDASVATGNTSPASWSVSALNGCAMSTLPRKNKR